MTEFTVEEALRTMQRGLAKMTGRPLVLSDYAPESYREALRTNETWVPKKLSCPMPWYDELEQRGGGG